MLTKAVLKYYVISPETVLIFPYYDIVEQRYINIVDLNYHKKHYSLLMAGVCLSRLFILIFQFFNLLRNHKINKIHWDGPFPIYTPRRDELSTSRNVSEN
jgi:hypothetical protein